MYLLRNFLKQPKQYAEAEKLWRDTWSSLIMRIGQEKRWRVPWFEPRFVNGTPFLDGNPIFTAVDRSRRLAVRIIQSPPTADGEPDLISWTDKFAKGDPEELDELVISCVLSDETLAKATDLMTKWARNGSLDDLARPAKAHRKPRTATPRRRRMSRA
jgi:hypothetical protein